MFAEQHGPLLPTLTHSPPPVQPLETEQVAAITRACVPALAAFLAAAVASSRARAAAAAATRAASGPGRPRPDDSRRASTSAAFNDYLDAYGEAATRAGRGRDAVPPPRPHAGGHDVDRRPRDGGGLGPDDGDGHARRPARRLGARAAVRARAEPATPTASGGSTSAESARRCQPGRGHQGFSPSSAPTPWRRRAARRTHPIGAAAAPTALYRRYRRTCHSL